VPDFASSIEAHHFLIQTAARATTALSPRYPQNNRGYQQEGKRTKSSHPQVSFLIRRFLFYRNPSIYITARWWQIQYLGSRFFITSSYIILQPTITKCSDPLYMRLSALKGLLYTRLSIFPAGRKLTWNDFAFQNVQNAVIRKDTWYRCQISVLMALHYSIKHGFVQIRNAATTLK